MNYRVKSRDEHLDPSLQPKRILTLDGGGVRGILSLYYLKKIEDLLRQKHGNNPSFRLSHYFDLIAGTSTGAIIASALALGHNVDFIINKYEQLADRVFKKNWLRWGIIRAKYSEKELIKSLQDPEIIGSDIVLGSPNIKTGLLIVAKRSDTGSLWPLINNPNGKYWDTIPGEENFANANFSLWQIVRASTAAPHFFKPEHLEVGKGKINGKLVIEEGDFIDGGVSTANNPALIAFMVATLDGFKLKWPKGKDKILLISVGTGLRNRNRKFPWYAAGNAVRGLVSIMDDCNDCVETMMQWVSYSDTKRKIDGEIESLSNDRLASEPILTYQRYNVQFEQDWIQNKLKLKYTDDMLSKMERMDKYGNIKMLEDLGKQAAEIQIKENHFNSDFDLS